MSQDQARRAPVIVREEKAKLRSITVMTCLLGED
jgi:hypothetical protein